METREISNIAPPQIVTAEVFDANKHALDNSVSWAINAEGVALLEVSADMKSCKLTPIKGICGTLLLSATLTASSGRVIEQSVCFTIIDPQPVAIQLSICDFAPPQEQPTA